MPRIQCTGGRGLKRPLQRPPNGKCRSSYLLAMPRATGAKMIERSLDSASDAENPPLTGPFRAVAVRPVTLLAMDSAASCITFVYHSGDQFWARAGPRPFDGEAIVAANAHGIEFLPKEVARLTAPREGP
jgi:hypothetical protein